VLLSLGVSPYAIFLKNPVLRAYAAGQFISMTGSWAQSIALSWLAYRLTHSSATVGLVTFALQAPAFLLSPLAGTVADRTSKRRIFLLTQWIGILQSLLLATLLFIALPGGPAAGQQTPDAETILPWLLALSILQGLNNAFEITARHSLTAEIVAVGTGERGRLSQAVAFNAMINNSTRVLGPALAGLLIRVSDERWCFLLNAGSYVANLLAFRAIPELGAPAPARVTKLLQSMADGFRYVGRRPRMVRILLAASGLSAISSTYSVLLPGFARQALGGGAEVFSWLTTAGAIGAIAGVGSVHSFESQRRSLRQEFLRGLLWVGCAIVVFAFSRSLPLSLGCALVIGFYTVRAWPLMNTAMQKMSDDSMRGRVMSFFMMTFLGTTPAASVLAGWVSDHLGSERILLATGLISLALPILLLWKNSGDLNYGLGPNGPGGPAELPGAAPSSAEPTEKASGAALERVPETGGKSVKKSLVETSVSEQSIAKSQPVESSRHLTWGLLAGVLLLPLSALLGAPTTAQAGVSLVGSFAAGESKTTPVDPNRTMGAGLGGGLLLGIKSSRRVSLQIGALYTPLVFKLSGAAIKQNYLQLPVLLRLRLGRMVSMGVGVSYDLKQGGAYEANIANSSYDSFFKNNLSGVASLAFRLPIKKRFGLLLDGRYHIGLTDHGGGSKYTQILALGGFDIAF
jgi:MFS family permease